MAQRAITPSTLRCTQPEFAIPTPSACSRPKREPPIEPQIIVKSAVPVDARLFAAEVVIQATERHPLGSPIAPPKTPQSARDPRSQPANRPRDRQVDYLASERVTRLAAQARHAVTAIIGHPHIDETLGDAEGRRGFGAAPSVDENALYDQCAASGRYRARPDGSGVHTALTQGGNA